MNHADRIAAAKSRLGSRLAILAHHYQADDVVRHADLVGDSLELARRIPGLEAEYVVFCGVFFMAETAAILARPGQQIHIPDRGAGCIMSNMAPDTLVAAILERLEQAGRRVTAVTYVNSSAGVKAAVGARGGVVCTSANADKVVGWAREQGDQILFLPDRNLALNTADRLGVPEADRLVLDIGGKGLRFDTHQAAQRPYLIWPGCCAIHQRFKTSHLAALRAAHPGLRIIVHPECPPDVVRLADVAGSTSTIIREVAQAPAGALLAIGTEINLVERLAQRWAGTKTILPLLVSSCANMAKVTEAKLADQLERLGQEAPVKVDEAVAQPARLALERMLRIS